MGRVVHQGPCQHHDVKEEVESWTWSAKNPQRGKLTHYSKNYPSKGWTCRPYRLASKDNFC